LSYVTHKAELKLSC